MSERQRSGAKRASRIVTRLRELISALDRRMSHADRPGEPGILRDARRLRREAVAQLDALTGERSRDKKYDQALVGAIMTDDGGAAQSE